MIHRRVRPALLAAALSILLGSLLVSSASAAVTSSQITSPGDPSFPSFVVEPLGSASEQSLTVTGTTVTDDANASDTVELGCFYIEEGGTPRERVVENLEGESVTLTVHPDGTFTTADLSGNEVIALSSLRIEQPCTLRAVPVGTVASENVEAFTGPRLGDAGIYTNGNSESEIYDDYLNSTTLAGNWEWDSAGSCGPYGTVYDTSSFRRADIYVADCEADLYQDNEAETAAGIVVDTHNAYDVTSARDIHNGASGQPFLQLSAPSYDQATGDLSQTETEELVFCEASGSIVDKLDPSGGECEKFIPSGVKLVRTITTGKGGLQARVSDRFESTDGKGHTISLAYGEEQAEGGPHQGASFKFAGESTFNAHSSGDTAPTGSSSPETIYYQTDTEAADLENGLENPRGAITLSTVPDAVHFTRAERFELDYSNRAVPATGALTFVQSLSQSLTQSGVEALASEAQEQLAGPALSIESPATGTTVSTPSVSLSGTATANLGLTSLSVNGTAVSVGEGGKWSTSVALSLGANTITATATDQAGRTKSTSITVTYTPLTITPPPPVAHAVKVGSASGANGHVTFTLACVGPIGSRCIVKTTVTTIEKLHGKKIKGVAARSKRVTVASATVTIRAGQRVRVSLKLNAVGRKLLARFKRLPVHLSALYTGTGGGAKSTAIAQNLTVKPRKHAKHKH